MFPPTRPPFSIAIRRRCRRRCTRNRTAPPRRVGPPAPPAPAPTVTNAAFDSRASPMSRTAIAREIGGAESSTTSAKAALRNNTSAHHAALAASRGRTTHNPLFPRSAQSRGASVRDASMYATHSPRSIAASTIARSRVNLPVGPTTSVRRPRGNPPDASARSSSSTPVHIPVASGSGAGRSARSDSTRSVEGIRAATAVLTSKTQVQSSGLDPKKDRKCAMRKVNRQRLSADGFQHLVHTVLDQNSNINWLGTGGPISDSSSSSSS